MLDPVSAHIELIQRDNIFRVVIADIVIRAELTLNGLIGCQQIGNLNIQFFSTLVTYKVDLLVSGSADSHFIVPAQQLQIHDELIVECPEGEAEQVQRLLAEEMEHVAELAVPLTAEAHAGKSWAEAKG